MHPSPIERVIKSGLNGVHTTHDFNSSERVVITWRLKRPAQF